MPAVAGSTKGYKSRIAPVASQLTAILQVISHTFALRARVRYRLSCQMSEQSYMQA